MTKTLICLAWLWCATAATAAETAPTPPRYTFSYPLDGSTLKPRGGTTRGVPVTVDTQPSPAWQALQSPGLTPQERDRRAILAMAGRYRVSFDFLEIASYTAADDPQKLGPYQSWGTEKVYVDRDEPGFVSLVHILDMRFVDKDGKPSAPMVTKHWRQDWRYEPEALVEYRGRDRWQRRAVPQAERRGAWSQTVYQVDESPRYASLGRWQHNASFSTWISGETWRPLPRREWSVRKDYDTLIGSNRHTVHPTGWTQEEYNLKARLDAERRPDAGFPYLGREVGMARYERLKDGDFTGADRYYAATRSFWHEVLAAWQGAFVKHGTVTLKGPVDKLGLFVPLFERAGEIEDGQAKGEHAPVIRKALADMGVPP
ncbi:hypothetical protein LRS03_24340 [Rhizobacter sp. J219]|uniref:DUF6607 family protein n=1 Tax=Rhizobacter sp. J219 TaxID=2898430 RepID=UPI002150B91D|nr:DUF6607 family protein [Rhizobacter sp. J219]MCR5885817.1 hypothetical protein [Rhizobacter sp. J219]